jgi:hypothetical protein
MADSRTHSWSIDRIQCSEWGHSRNVADVWASNWNSDEISFSMSPHPDGFSVFYNIEVNFLSPDLHPYYGQEIIEEQLLAEAEELLITWWKSLEKSREFLKLKQGQISRGLPAEDSLYAVIAYMYVLRAQMQPLLVTQLLSEDLSVPNTTIKERIRKSREKEFLTSPGKGMNGQGEMTSKAVKLLKKEGFLSDKK